MTSNAHVGPIPAHSQTPTPSGAVPSTRGVVQRKRGLRSLGFDAQEAALAPVQASDGDLNGDVHAAAARGVKDGGASMPHLDAIQAAFGHHDVSGVRAHVGGEAASASRAIGASAYATGNDVAFGDAPDLHTAAHEAAHVVQQRSGVSLAGGVGQSGDHYEQHADQVADAVVRGESAEGLLGGAGGGHAAGDVQQKALQKKAVQRAEGEQSEADPAVCEGPPAADGGACEAQPEAAAEPEAGVCEAPPAAEGGVCEAPAPGAEPGKSKAGGDKAEAGKGFGVKNSSGKSMGLNLKAGTDGMSAQLYGKMAKSWQVPVPELPGLFVELSLSGTASGTVARKNDGTIEGTAALSGEAKATLNYGIPKVASVYGGGKATVKVDALKVKGPADGEWEVELPVASLKVALTVGAKLDVELPLPNGWKFASSNNFEWNPGGEFELLKAGHIGGQWTITKGKDVDRLVEAMKSLASAGESWADRDNKGRQSATDPQRLPPGKI